MRYEEQLQEELKQLNEEVVHWSDKKLKETMDLAQRAGYVNIQAVLADEMMYRSGQRMGEAEKRFLEM